MADPNQTARRALDERLLALRNQAVHNPTPSRGWVRAVREALGMSREDLARRLGMTRQGVLRIERAEADGAITLSKLREVAAALDCQLFYALVPREPLEEVVRERARFLAERQLGRVRQTMRLEDQLAHRPDREALVEDLARNIASSRDLWRAG